MDANAIRAGRAVVEFAADRTPLLTGLREVESSLLQWTAGIGAAMASAGAGTLFGLLPAIRAASTQAETLNAFTEVFRGANDEASQLASTLANEVGRSTNSIRTISTPIGAMVKGLGLSADEAARFAHSAAAAAIDISSFYNQDVEETAARIRSALSGSSEAVDQFGINLRQSALSAKLAELGYSANIQQASELEKTLARLALIQESLARQNALGDAARTAGQFANASRTLSDGLTSLRAAIGTALLPAAERILAVLARLALSAADFAAAHPRLVQAFAAIAVAAVAAGAALIGLAVVVKGLLIVGQVAFVVKLAQLAFISLSPAVAAATTAIGGFVSGSAQASAGVSALTRILGTLGTATQTYVLPFLAKLPLFRLLIPIMQGIGAAIAVVTGPIGWAVAGLAALAAGAVILQRQFGFFDPLLAQLSAVGQELRSRLQPAFTALAQAWSGQIAPALGELGNALRSGLGELGAFAMALLRLGSPLVTQPLQDLGRLFSGILVSGIKLLTATVEALTGALLIAYDAAASLGLVVSREERDRGERLDRQIAQQRSRRDSSAAAGGGSREGEPPAVVVTQELESFARSVAESTRTPLEEYQRYMDQLSQAFQAGLITAEQYRRGQAQAQKDLQEQDPRVKEARRQAEELKSFGASLREAVRTPQEKFREQMEQLAKAAEQGAIDAETFVRGQAKYLAELEDVHRQAAEAERAKQEELAKAAEQQRQEMRERINSSASRREKVNAILYQGEELRQKQQDSRLRQATELGQAGFRNEADNIAIDVIGDVVSRARDLEQRAKESKASAGFGSFSRVEATAGLGQNTVDQKLLEEAKDASKQRRRALEALEKLLSHFEY